MRGFLMRRGLMHCGLMIGSLLAGSLGAQQATTTSFTTGDGSRFVLAPDASVPQVHWVVATLADGSDDPPGLEGLAMATARASLGGTWLTGSTDAARERTALADLSAAWQAKLASPADNEVSQHVVDATKAAETLGDSQTFLRVLASLPVYHPEMETHRPLATLTLTTLPEAIPAVARRLVERREQQALRDLPTVWMRELLARADRHFAEPDNAVRTEVLALVMPNHPELRLLERPMMQAPSHQQALQVWAATQYPSRTVNVLLGNFDVDTVKASLEQEFASTQLPAPRPTTSSAPRPILVSRNSIVPGVPTPMVALAWVLPPIADRFVLAAATAWLADGADAFLAQHLARAGRRDVRLSCRAPWPAAVDGRSLLMIEAVDAGGTKGLADLVLRGCRAAVEKPPSTESVQAANNLLQQRWRALGNEPRQLACEVAAAALLWPNQEPTTRWPERIDPKLVQSLLQAVFASQPVIVEGRP